MTTMSTIPGPAWLFCPADRPERYGKAAAIADVVILDLEDGVAHADKDYARRCLVDTPLDPERTVVRVNPVGTEEHAEDLKALAKTAYTRVMLAKCESAEQVTSLAPREVVALATEPRKLVVGAKPRRASTEAGDGEVPEVPRRARFSRQCTATGTREE